jgi:hypothetical protein
MGGWGDSSAEGGFGGGIGSARAVAVDVYTDAYRISGIVETRFSRVTEILNQLSGAHITVVDATVSEHADPTATAMAPRVLVSVDAILLMVAGDLGGSSAEMRIPKRPVLTQLSMPPFRITGRVHVSTGSESTDGIVMGTDRFIAMTDATIASGVHPDLGRTAGVLAVRRDRAHVILVADDERPDELLADVLDGPAEA